MIIRAGLTACLSTICVACAPAKDVDEMQARLDAMESRIVALEADASKRAKIGFDDLDLALSLAIKHDPLDQSARLQVGGTGYAVAWTMHGPATASFKDIRPLGSGARATVEIVNMTAVNWTDVTLMVRYDNWNYEDLNTNGFKAEQKETTIKMTSMLKSGSSTVVDIDLPDMKHDSIKNIYVSILPGGISYKR